jgi:hypothetical protein
MSPVDRWLGNCDVKQRVDHVVLHALHEFLEHFVAFGAVHHQRVSLAISVQPYPSPQVFHASQVVHPVDVDGPEQQQSF